MKHFIVTLLVGFWLLGPHAFADVNAKNGISITTASTINGKTPNSAFNGLAIVSGGGGGPAVIANTGAAGTADSATTGSINTTGANLLVVSACWYPGVAADAAITDSKGNTWTALTRHGTVGVSVTANRLFYCYGGTVGSGHTFTASATGGYLSIQVIALSNMSASPFDQQNGAQDGGLWTTNQPGTITPSQANTVVIASLTFEANSSGTISINDSYTITNTIPHGVGTNEGGSMAYKILTSATAQNPTWTSSSSSSDAALSIASFKY